MTQDAAKKDQDDAFGGTAIERAMINKIGKMPDNFRVYCAGWIGKTPADWKTMSVAGALFEPITRGKRKGRMLKMIVGTKRSVTVTREEIKVATAQVEAEAAHTGVIAEA